jgi:hypothetical protein
MVASGPSGAYLAAGRRGCAPASARTFRQLSRAGSYRGRGRRPAPGPGQEIVAFAGHRRPSSAALLTVHQPIPSAAGAGPSDTRSARPDPANLHAGNRIVNVAAAGKYSAIRRKRASFSRNAL